jgi:DNA-directed RNA polymerase subunit RPC12/RpoP
MSKSEVVLKCGWCGRLVERLPEGKLRCPYCSHRVLYKIRADKLVKRVRAV